MLAVFSLLFLPLILFIAVVIVVPIACISSTRYKKYYVQDTAAQRTAPQPSVYIDQEQVKIMYRRDLLNRFIRGSLRNVRDWRVVGDTEEHDMFYTLNVLNNKQLDVIVYFLDGTESKVSVDISAFKRIEKERLSFLVLPKPDNEQKKLVELEEKAKAVTAKTKPAEEETSLEKTEYNAVTAKEEPKQEIQKPEEKPESSSEADHSPEGIKENSSVDEIINKFLARKDVFDILENRKDIVLEENVPNDEAVFEQCKSYLMMEHAVILYKSSNGWGFNFS